MSDDATVNPSALWSTHFPQAPCKPYVTILHMDQVRVLASIHILNISEVFLFFQVKNKQKV